MKKQYLYFVAPLIGLALFGVVYWQYASTYDAKIAAADKKMRDDREEKVRKDNENKLAAVTAALQAQEDRKKKKADKDLKDQQEKDERDRLVQVRLKSIDDAGKLAEQAERLKKQIEENKKVNAKIEEDKKQLIAEEAHLRELVKLSAANKKSLETVLEKIDAAEKMAIANAKAAAAAAAQSQKK